MSKHFMSLAPQSEAEVRAEHDATWMEFMEKVHRGYNGQQISAVEYIFLERLAGRDGCPPVALASNGHANCAVYESLHYQFTAISDCDETLELLHVTVALNDWATSDEKTVLRLGELKRAARPILAAMAPNYVARIECQSVTNLRHDDGGRTICPHLHATLWGRDIRVAAQALAADLNKTLKATYPGAPAIVVDSIRPTSIDIVRVVRYAGKAPNRDTTLYVHPTTGRTNAHQSEASDRYISFLRQFQILSLLEIDRLMFAGGQGMAVRNIALQAARVAVERRRGCRSRPKELADIEAFWIRFARTYMDSRFIQPQIIL